MGTWLCVRVMGHTVSSLIAALRAAVASLDASSLTAADAMALVETFAEGERLCAAGRTLATARVQDTRAWRGTGHRSAAHWVASRTHSTVTAAMASLETARRIDSLPATREALVTGKLSEVQVVEIAAAASADPGAEASLLLGAERSSVAGLRERCRAVIAAARPDEDAFERIRRSRYVRRFIDRDGAFRLDARLAPDDGARLHSVLVARGEQLQGEARRSGQREPAEAYLADALVGFADGAPGPRAVVHVMVDEAALARGSVAPGETCEIVGTGSIPVTTARRLAGDAIIKVIGRDGADVTRVSHLGRTIPSRVRTALEARDPTCVVPGCDMRSGLEIDHVIPFAKGGPTQLDNLARLCRFHHAAKTHHGWVLGGAPGARTWERRHGNGALSGRPPPARAP